MRSNLDHLKSCYWAPEIKTTFQLILIKNYLQKQYFLRNAFSIQSNWFPNSIQAKVQFFNWPSWVPSFEYTVCYHPFSAPPSECFVICVRTRRLSEGRGTVPLAPIICYSRPQTHSERRFLLKEELLINCALNELKIVIKSEINVMKIESQVSRTPKILINANVELARPIRAAYPSIIIKTFN